MKIINFFRILFENIIFFVIILTLLNCSMNSQINNKKDNINNVEFKINKTNEVKLTND
jgi:hypothetical protein